MNCECCSLYPRTAGNAKFADIAGMSQYKHNTIVKHNRSLVCVRRDLLINEKAMPLPVAFRRLQLPARAGQLI